MRPNMALVHMLAGLAGAGYGIFKSGFRGYYFDKDNYTSDAFDTFDLAVCAAYAHMVIEKVREST